MAQRKGSVVVAVLLAFCWSSWSTARAAAHGAIDEQIATLASRIKEDPQNAALYLKRGELHSYHLDWDAATAPRRYTGWTRASSGSARLSRCSSSRSRSSSLESGTTPRSPGSRPSPHSRPARRPGWRTAGTSSSRPDERPRPGSPTNRRWRRSSRSPRAIARPERQRNWRPRSAPCWREESLTWRLPNEPRESLDLRHTRRSLVHCNCALRRAGTDRHTRPLPANGNADERGRPMAHRRRRK